MALKGVPAFYLPALLASDNDVQSFSKTGQRRDLNREKFELDNLLLVLNNSDSFASKNLKFLSHAMKTRSNLISFHPSSEMKCLSKDRSDIIVIQRGEGLNTLIAIHNFTENKLSYSINNHEFSNNKEKNSSFKDYLSGKIYKNLNFVLNPFDVLWIGLV